jgi:hypothetical protein
MFDKAPDFSDLLQMSWCVLNIYTFVADDSLSNANGNSFVCACINSGEKLARN